MTNSHRTNTTNPQRPTAVAVIMAGGSGTRFWPLSRREKPKQLLTLFSHRTMLDETISRFTGLVGKNHIYLATNPTIARQCKKSAKKAQYIIEPQPKNTAACIGFSAIRLLKKYGPGAIMIIETCDHVYESRQAYHAHLRKAVELARLNKLVLLGIAPTYPSTGFGYIKLGSLFTYGTLKSYHVEKFIEKPNLRRATLLIKNPRNVWNSGVFVVRVGKVLSEIKTHMPLLARGLKAIYEDNFRKQTIAQEFARLPDISFDYGVVEKCTSLVCLRAAMGWDDIGDLSKLDALSQKDAFGNVLSKKSIFLDTANTTLSSKRMTALIGIKDLIIVDTDDVLLICAKENVQDVKKIVEKIKADPSLRKYL